jgi:hypothetical protein
MTQLSETTHLLSYTGLYWLDRNSGVRFRDSNKKIKGAVIG